MPAGCRTWRRAFLSEAEQHRPVNERESRPETERVGILRIPTTRGDRLFLTLVGAAFINLCQVQAIQAKSGMSPLPDHTRPRAKPLAM
jgi:hypothetical protein